MIKLRPPPPALLRELPCSPLNCYAERVIGSIRPECTDHIIAFGERHLRRILREYEEYYNEARPHLSLDRNSPEPHRAEVFGEASAYLGGLHHRYFRAA